MNRLPEPRRSSTGGKIVYTNTGLIHYSGARYSGDYDEKQATVGRPVKDKIKISPDLKINVHAQAKE